MGYHNFQTLSDFSPQDALIFLHADMPFWPLFVPTPDVTPCTRLPSRPAGCPMSPGPGCLHTTELSACSTSFPEIEGGKNPDPLALTIYSPRNIGIAKSGHNSHWVTLRWIPPPGKGECGSSRAPLSPAESWVKDPSLCGFATPPRIPTGTSTLTYIQPLPDNELALLWYASLQSTRGAHKGKHLSWLLCFLFCWATASLSRSHIWPSCCLPNPLLSQHPAEKHLEKEFLLPHLGRRNTTLDTAEETSRGHCSFVQKDTS